MLDHVRQQITGCAPLILVLVLFTASAASFQDYWREKQKVYVTKSGTKYHREGCSSLRNSRIAISLDEAAKKYNPCSRCSPPMISSRNSLKLNSGQKRSSSSEGGQCQAITKKGKRCSRTAQAGSTYSWQHRK